MSKRKLFGTIPLALVALVLALIIAGYSSMSTSSTVFAATHRTLRRINGEC